MRSVQQLPSPVIARLRGILVEQMRSLIGTPFFHAAREPGIGLDCVGVILVPAWTMKLTAYQPPNYGPDFDRNLLVNCVAAAMERIDIKWEARDYETRGVPKALPGDVLLFALHGQPAHLAYATGEGSMVHAHQKPEAVIEEDISEAWAKRLVSVWRWPALMED